MPACSRFIFHANSSSNISYHTMYTRTHQKFFVVVCGLVAQSIITYFDNGVFQSVLAGLATCGALVAIHFSNNEGEISLDQERPMTKE